MRGVAKAARTRVQPNPQCPPKATRGMKDTTMTSRAARMTATLVALMLSGCATVDPHSGFSAVQERVAERTRQSIAWNQGDDEDLAIRERSQDFFHSELTADVAVQIALLNNRELQATYEDLGIAQADLIAAGLLKNPVLEAEFRWPGRPANPWEIHVVQDFMDALLLPLRERVAADAFEQAKLKVAHAVLDIDAEVRTAFYSAQGAEQSAGLRGKVAEALETVALIAERRYEAGNINDLELANEQAARLEARAELLRAKAEALDQRERLTGLMGLWGVQAADWRMGEHLPDLPGDEAPAEGLESLAVANRLDLAAARQEIVKLADAAGLAAYAGLVPQLNVAGHIEREPEGEATWGPSVALPVPVFDQGQAVVGRAQAQLRQSRQRYWALAVRIRSEVRGARNRMVAARQLADQYRNDLLPLRRRIVAESQLQYNAMQVGPAELLRAHQAELEAGGRYVDALRDYWVARVKLERALGTRFPPAAPAATPTSPPAAGHTMALSNLVQQPQGQGGQP